MNTPSPLRKLIALDGDFKTSVSDAQKFLQNAQNTQDPSGETILTVADIKHSLQLFIDGRLDKKQLQKWSEILEMNDLVDYEAGKEEVIADILFLLSTPEINEPISHDLALELQSKLESK